MVWRSAFVLLIMALSAAGCRQPFSLTAADPGEDPFLDEVAHHDTEPFPCGRASVSETEVIEQQTARLPLLHDEVEFVDVGEP
jgi:hypothetical protein